MGQCMNLDFCRLLAANRMLLTAAAKTAARCKFAVHSLCLCSFESSQFSKRRKNMQQVLLLTLHKHCMFGAPELMQEILHLKLV